MKVAGDRPGRSRTPITLSARSDSVVLAGLDVLREVPGYRAEPDDASHRASSTWDAAHSVSASHGRRLELRRVVVAHRFVSVSASAPNSPKITMCRGDRLEVAPRLRHNVSVPTRIRVTVIDRAVRKVFRQVPRLPLCDKRPLKGLKIRCGPTASAANDRFGGTRARYRRSAARRRGCCTSAGRGPCQCGCAVGAGPCHLPR